jgi:hypothetical protein
MAYDSAEYAWNDITVVAGGRVLGNLIEIKLSIKRKVTQIFGKGGKAKSRTKGNKVFTGTLGVLQSELIAFEQSAGKGKDATDITFDIIWNFTPKEGGEINTILIKDVDIEEYEIGMKQDDANMNVQLKFVAGDYIPNI